VYITTTTRYLPVKKEKQQMRDDKKRSRDMQETERTIEMPRDYKRRKEKSKAYGRLNI
jgi:hypothetical protein